MMVHSNGKPITDEEIPNLIALSYQESIKKEKESTNIIFHRTEREEELCIQFMMNHGDEMDRRCEAFEKSYNEALQATSIDKKIELCEKAISLFEKAKKFAYKTKGGTIYFQDMYEHIHNSRNEDFSYLDFIEDELDSLIYDRDYNIPTLKKSFLSITE